jgi:hypothetical protein
MSEEETTNDTAHRIRVTTGNVTVEVEGTEEFVDNRFEDLKKDYLRGEVNVGGSGDTNQKNTGFAPEGSGDKPLSLSEISRKIDLPYKRDAALLTGWYLEYVEGQDEFTRADIEEKATEAKIELGKNLPRDINKLVERGLFLQVGEREGSKTYYLTRTGEEYVEEELNLEEL